MTRLLVECTHVFKHPKVNSGIQRVVRNVIRELPKKDPSLQCSPVVMLNGALYEVISLAPLAVPKLDLMGLRVRLEQIASKFWLLHRKLERRRPFCQSKFARRVLYVGCRLAVFGALSVPIRLLNFCLKRQEIPTRCKPLQHQAGDQLVLLDSSWQTNFFPLAEQLKRDGVGIVSVVYDLIPLTHPQFCDAGLVKVFDQWFDWIAKTADGFMAISKTISQQVERELQLRLGAEEAGRRWHGHFHLGSELDLARAEAPLQPELQRMFAQKEPVYLMVSTIEPRKNHAYLLDAFELLWAQGSTARLCIIGKVGWKCDALIERINKHPLNNKCLFMFNGINDKSLEYAYSNARALVFPSYAEGFGLPLVEAMQRGLPAMASDIPVFREIGGDFMAYFDLNDPQTLAEHIRTFETTGQFPAARPVTEWQWVDWNGAARQLISGTLSGIRRASKPSVQAAAVAHADCP